MPGPDIKLCLFVFSFFLFSSCQLPPALYVLDTPLGFTCSTDYDPSLDAAEQKATWLFSCQNTTNTWLRFSVFANKADTSGFIFYHDPSLATDYQTFLAFVHAHIINGIVTPSPNIIPFIADDTCSSVDPSGVDRGQTFPSIYLTYPTKYSSTDTYHHIYGLDNVANQQTSIIIPPLTCLGTGSFIVTAVDYINKAESQPSNIMVLTP